MIISSIVAFSNNNVIGVDNDLPWHLPNDLKYFKRCTSNHAIIMGRKTFESIGKPLLNRLNIIVSRNPDYKVEGARVFENLALAIEFCESKAMDEVFFIGGEQIFKECIKWTDKLYVTRVQTTIDTNSYEESIAFFPEISWENWELQEKEEYTKDEKNAFDHTFEVYQRSE